MAAGDLAKDRAIGAPAGPRLRYDAFSEEPWPWSGGREKPEGGGPTTRPIARRRIGRSLIDEMARPTWRRANLPADGVTLHAPGFAAPRSDPSLVFLLTAESLPRDHPSTTSRSWPRARNPAKTSGSSLSSTTILPGADVRG